MDRAMLERHRVVRWKPSFPFLSFPVVAMSNQVFAQCGLGALHNIARTYTLVYENSVVYRSRVKQSEAGCPVPPFCLRFVVVVSGSLVGTVHVIVCLMLYRYWYSVGTTRFWATVRRRLNG